MEKYQNAKKGFIKLTIGEILIIIDSFTDLFKVDSFVFILVLLILSIIGLIINLKGLKLVAKDDAGYKRARKWAIGSLVVVIVGVVVAGIADIFSTSLGSAVSKLIQAGNSACEFVASYFIVQTSIVILDKNEKLNLSSFAKKTLNLYLVSFLLGNIIYAFMIFDSPTLVMIAKVLSTAGSILDLIAKLMYLIFLYKMYKIIPNEKGC
ncbi:MAG: hypothetical protein Q4E33_00265 [Erysipelotrichaceae bacterium]|nr:hypothetical protein [Erysipelotrichaceae bacterium]